MLLAIETATSICSVALIDGGKVIASADENVGRGHAEHLLPMIANLPHGGRADRIVASIGPGSFTGIRVGLAAAQGLGIAWGSPVHGFSTLALTAAACFAAHPDCEAVLVVNEGGHGEVFAQEFTAAPFMECGPMRSAIPEEVADQAAAKAITGSAAEKIEAIAKGCCIKISEIAARHIVGFPDSFIALPPRPTYGRGPDARLPK